MSEIESREFAEFKNQPKGLHFQLMSKEGSASVYNKAKKRPIKYTPNGHLFSIRLSDR